MRKAHEAQPGDVYTDKRGKHVVRDVEITATSVRLLLDNRQWIDLETDADAPLSREGDPEDPKPATGSQKPPQSVLNAIAAFRDTVQAEYAVERKRQAERRAILHMATDEAAKEWQGYYYEQTNEIYKTFEERQEKNLKG